MGDDILYGQCLTILLLTLVTLGLEKTSTLARQQRAEDSQMLCSCLGEPGWSCWCPCRGRRASCTGRMGACHGKGCPVPRQHWNQLSALAQKRFSYPPSSSRHLMAADQTPQTLPESRAKAFCPSQVFCKRRESVKILQDTGQ